MASAEQQTFIAQLHALGVRTGDTVLVHASFNALGCRSMTPTDVIAGLLQVVGDRGNLLMPALSYAQHPPHIHSTLGTPSNVGIIAETFRTRPGTHRSVHPTHSVCGTGPDVAALFTDHHLDTTPCGPHSPFHKLPAMDGKILMLGCGLRPNTSMHAIEELCPPPYLFGEMCEYTITNADGVTYRKWYRTHGFDGWEQRYDRIQMLNVPGMISQGRVLASVSFLIRADALRDAVASTLCECPTYFVDPRPSTPTCPRPDEPGRLAD